MTARYILVCALLAVTAEAVAAPNPRYAPVLPELKARTRLPLLLPAWLPPDAGGRYPQASADAHFYTVDLAYAPDCNGAQACTGITIRAEDAVAVARRVRAAGLFGSSHPDTVRYLRQTYQSGRRVSLRRGVVGWYAVPGPSADGGETTLTWHYRSAYYSLSMRSLVPARVMVHCAASALP